MQPKTYVFFGIVGSGKGTQIKLLSDYLKSKDGRDTLHVYPGNAYRKHISEGTLLGRLVKSSMEAGHLQPNFLTDAIVTGIMIDSLKEDEHLIVDGYPRTVQQSINFIEMMKYFQREDVKVVYIALSEEEAMKRNLLRGRFDDTEEGLKRRFAEYKNNVVPSMKYLEDNGYEIITINGEQTIENVHKDIINALHI